MNIAVMPGDGVGPEVVAEALKVLRVAGERFGFSMKTSDFPYGAEHYLTWKPASRCRTRRWRNSASTTRSCSARSASTRRA